MKKKGNLIKAVIYTAVGVLMTLLSIGSGIFVRLTGSFLPVYAEGVYLQMNRIIRWGIYAIIPVIAVLSILLAEYGIKYLIKYYQQNRRRH